ncbi:AsnC family transcriptional regulator [Candidatus Gracilibacteria bacterium]|nr:AsnC family transcriptional regulator [Candidatus Gracilibacteria bacterium]
MSTKSQIPALDATDWRIIEALQQDARCSFAELGRRVGLSNPSVAERVRKLEDAGIIQGYHAHVDASTVGLPLTAFIQLRCHAPQCLVQTNDARTMPEVVELYKTAGTYCALLKVHVVSLRHLEALNRRLAAYAEQVTTVVTSCAVRQQPITAAHRQRIDEEPCKLNV